MTDVGEEGAGITGGLKMLINATNWLIIFIGPLWSKLRTGLMYLKSDTISYANVIS